MHVDEEIEKALKVLLSLVSHVGSGREEDAYGVIYKYFHPEND